MFIFKKQKSIVLKCKNTTNLAIRSKYLPIFEIKSLILGFLDWAHRYRVIRQFCMQSVTALTGYNIKKIYSINIFKMVFSGIASTQYA